MNIDQIRIIVINVITESKTKEDLLKALDYGMCFVLGNCEDDDRNEICKCGHHSKDHSYNPDDFGLNNNLVCDICNCKNYVEDKNEEESTIKD